LQKYNVALACSGASLFALAVTRFLQVDLHSKWLAAHLLLLLLLARRALRRIWAGSSITLTVALS
jgi:hypothetical protein